MGQCCSAEAESAAGNEGIKAASFSLARPSPSLKPLAPLQQQSLESYNNSFQAIPCPTPLPAGVRSSPATPKTPGRRFKWPLPLPSPAKPIMAIMSQKGQDAERAEKQGTIPEVRDGVAGGEETAAAAAEVKGMTLDKSFGFANNFAAEYELGREVGRGHFGHTWLAKAKKGQLKGQPVAVKIIFQS